MATTTPGKTGLFAFDPARCNAMSDGGAEGNGGAMAGLLRGYFHDDAVREAADFQSGKPSFWVGEGAFAELRRLALRKSTMDQPVSGALPPRGPAP